MNHATPIDGKELIQQIDHSDKYDPKLNPYFEIEHKDYGNLNDAFGIVYPDLSCLIRNIRDQELSKIKKMRRGESITFVDLINLQLRLLWE